MKKEAAKAAAALAEDKAQGEGLQLSAAGWKEGKVQLSPTEILAYQAELKEVARSLLSPLKDASPLSATFHVRARAFLGSSAPLLGLLTSDGTCEAGVVAVGRWPVKHAAFGY